MGVLERICTGDFQVVACSPPCTEFSRAKTTAPRDLQSADELVRVTLQIIRYLKPKTWWIENPRHGLLTTRDYMTELPYVDADYCQYSNWGYKKPTRFWGSPDVVMRHLKLCDGIHCENLHSRNPRKHRITLSSKNQNLPRHLKYRIPRSLIEAITGLDDRQNNMSVIHTA